MFRATTHQQSMVRFFLKIYSLKSTMVGYTHISCKDVPQTGWQTHHRECLPVPSTYSP